MAHVLLNAALEPQPATALLMGVSLLVAQESAADFRTKKSTSAGAAPDPVGASFEQTANQQVKSEGVDELLLRISELEGMEARAKEAQAATAVLRQQLLELEERLAEEKVRSYHTSSCCLA